MKLKQIIATIFWIGLGVFVMALSYKMDLGGFHSPGPGLMPFLLGALLCLVSLYLLVSSLLSGSFGGTAEEKGPAKIRLGKIMLVVVSLVVYSLVLQKLGYLISTALLLYLLFHAAGSKKVSAVISAVITTLLSYFVFTYLGLIFPPGVLRFLGV